MTGSSGPRVCTSFSLTGDTRGQMEPVGTILIMALVVMGTTAVAAFGAVVIEDTRQQSELERAEQTLTLFDSRAAMVALGASSQQTLDFPNANGNYEIRERTGWIRVTHNNYTGNGDTETIYNQSLGALVFTTDDSEIAYQGGGVWRKDGDGPARMISPPEFHYRDATLTLPLIRTTGSGYISGATTVTIDPTQRERHVFPNTTAAAKAADGTERGAPYNITGALYENPLNKGTINITVKGPYSEGWAEYFRTRTTGAVYADHDNETVTLQLKSTGNPLRDFQIPEPDGSVDVPSMATNHKVNEFQVELHGDKNGFNQLHWSLYTKDRPNTEFELHVASTQNLCGANPGTLDVSIYYYNSTTGVHQEWQNEAIDPYTDPNVDIDCDEKVLTIDFTSDTSLTYGDIDTQGSDNKWNYGPEIVANDAPSSTTIDQHEADCDTNGDGVCSDPAETDPTYTEDADAESLDFLVNHYFSLMGPTFELTVHEGPGKGNENNAGRVDASESSGYLDYEVTDDSRYITFLHITENEITVRFR